MKFIVSSSKLLKQLQIIAGVINSSNTLPILDNILEASRCVSDKFNIDFIVTSLSKDGIYLYDKDNDTGKLYNNKFVNRDEVIDVTGAGDIVLSLIAHNIDDLDKAILEANKIAQESTKHLGVMYL